ncbi:MAG: YqaA family protein [Flavobacteriales bacterium]
MFIFGQFISIKDAFDFVVANISSTTVFVIFFVSETILGLLPPDLFIMWGKRLALDEGLSPWTVLFFLATLSYLGGLIAYFLGLYLQKIDSVSHWVNKKHGDFFYKLNKWGGFLIGVAAMLPIPFSIVTTICGMTKFSFKVTAIVGLLRFVRFALYGVFLFLMV